MSLEVPFNNWQWERIFAGKKKITSRHKQYKKDERVDYIVRLPWFVIKKYLYGLEGAESPHQLQIVINNIYEREVPDDEMFYVHFMDFKKR